MRWLYELGLMSSDTVDVDVDGVADGPRRLLARSIAERVPLLSLVLIGFAVAVEALPAAAVR